MKPRIAPAILVALGCLLASTACGSSGATNQPKPAVTPTLPSRVSASIATDHGPAQLIVAADGVYVGNHRGGSVQRIDPATNKIASTMLVGGELGMPITADPASPLWVCTNVDGVLHQLDTAASRVTANVPAECDGGWRAVINGKVWALTGSDSPVLWVIDARTGEVLHKNPVDRWTGPPVAAGDKVYLGSGESGRTFVFSQDGTPLPPIAVETPWLWPAGGKLYRMPMDGQLAELDPVTLAPVHTYTVPKHEDGDPALVADDSGHLYYRPDYMKLYRIDIASGAVDMFLQLPWEETPTGLAWGFGSLWITNFEDDNVWRVNTSV